MTHKLNISNKIINNYPSVVRMEELVHEIDAYSSSSTKRFEELKQFILRESEGKKIVKRCKN